MYKMRLSEYSIYIESVKESCSFEDHITMDNLGRDGLLAS